ncbi:VirD4-like conjugal transfer protein, CD1115 family [Thermoanaerobacter mathranii]|uniref:VirD4-like conjugal transfer protein, CD1115 family n=1 Tax=Thermoanaerobacter mathranii TaxID=583357 RepID=UPI003D6C518F
MTDAKKISLYVLTGVFYLIFSIWAFVPLVKLHSAYKGYIVGMQPPDTSFLKAMYTNPLLSLKALTEPGVLGEWLIITVLSAVLLAALIFMLKEAEYEQKGVKYLKEDGTHGTSGWMTEKEAHRIKVFNRKILGIGINRGLIFGTLNGKEVTLHPDAPLNRNVAIFGSPGSMKSVAYVRTNILQLAQEGQSMVITDPKGELFKDMAQFLRDRGYNVKLFNLVNMAYSDRWNPLDVIADDIDAQTFADVIIANTKVAATKSGDPFWDRAEQNLLKALALYVAKEYPPNERNLASVYSLLAHPEPRKIDMIFKSLPKDHPAKMPYNIYSQASETVRTGVVIGLGTRLQVFQNKLVQKLTEVSDIDLELPGKEKCAYFCIISDMDSTFDFLAGLFFSFLFLKLIRYADMYGKNGQCNPHVYFLLDEFPNIGAIPDFTKKLATMRSRGVHSSIVFQNIAQLKNRYPNDAWQEIIGSCDSKLFLGCTDTATAEFVSALLGTATVESKSRTKEAGFEGIFDFGRVTTSVQKRNLLNPDEIIRFDPEKAILILRGQKPLQIKKMPYTLHPLAKYVKPVPVSSYTPEWSKEFREGYSNGKGNEKDDTTALKDTDEEKQYVQRESEGTEQTIHSNPNDSTANTLLEDTVKESSAENEKREDRPVKESKKDKPHFELTIDLESNKELARMLKSTGGDKSEDISKDEKESENSKKHKKSSIW